MFIWLSLTVIVCIAFLGIVARFVSLSGLPFQAEVGAIGGYALGLAGVWISFSLVRNCLIHLLAPIAAVGDIVSGTVWMFYVETWILLLAVIGQLRYLQGDFTAQSEWYPSLTDGACFSAKLVALNTVFFIPCLWAIDPGERGVFQGTPASFLVSECVAAKINGTLAECDPIQIANIQRQSAIPDALILTTFPSLLFLSIRPAKNYLSRVLSDQYLHVRNVNVENPRINRIPRGGGHN